MSLKQYFQIFFCGIALAAQAQQPFPNYVGKELSMPDEQTLALVAHKMFFTEQGQDVWSNYVRVYARQGDDWKPKGQDLFLPQSLPSLALTKVQMPDANTLVLGLSCALVAGEECQGWVQVYAWKEGAWQAKGQAFEAGLSQGGDYIAFMPDANTLAIGDWANREQEDKAGVVRIYAWNGQKWLQKGQDLRGKGPLNSFGSSLQMPDDQTIVVGAYLGEDYRGYAQVYAWNGKKWREKGKPIVGKPKAWAGYALAMPNAQTLALSQPNHQPQTPGVGLGNGLVQVYEWKGKAWVQKGQDLGNEPSARCGHALAMPDAQTIAFTCPDKDVDAPNGQGQDLGLARVYAWDGGAWKSKGEDILGQGFKACMGYSLAMPSANHLILGGVDNCGIGQYQGKLSFYRWKDNQWIKVGE